MAGRVYNLLLFNITISLSNSLGECRGNSSCLRESLRTLFTRGVPLSTFHMETVVRERHHQWRNTVVFGTF